MLEEIIKYTKIQWGDKRSKYYEINGYGIVEVKTNRKIGNTNDSDRKRESTAKQYR